MKKIKTEHKRFHKSSLFCLPILSALIFTHCGPSTTTSTNTTTGLYGSTPSVITPLPYNTGNVATGTNATCGQGLQLGQLLGTYTGDLGDGNNIRISLNYDLTDNNLGTSTSGRVIGYGELTVGNIGAMLGYGAQSGLAGSGKYCVSSRNMQGQTEAGVLRRDSNAYSYIAMKLYSVSNMLPWFNNGNPTLPQYGNGMTPGAMVPGMTTPGMTPGYNPTMGYNQLGAVAGIPQGSSYFMVEFGEFTYPAYPTAIENNSAIRGEVIVTLVNQMGSAIWRKVISK